MPYVVIPRRVIDNQHMLSTINHMLKIYYNTTLHNVRFLDNDITNLQRSNLIFLRGIPQRVNN
jgi:hypothetical protein